MNLKKIAAALLAGVMALSLGACASENVKWIAEVNGEQIPSGVYLTYLMGAYNRASNKVADPEKDILKQEVEGVPASQWIQQEADQSFAMFVAVESEAKAQGLSLTAEELAGLNQSLQYQWQYLSEIYAKNGVSYESYVKAYSNDYMKSLLFNAQYGKDGKTPVPEDELLAAFRDGYYKTQYILLSLTDSNGAPLDDAGKQAVMDKANELLGKVSADGANFADVVLEYEKQKAVDEGKEESTVHEHDENSHLYYIDKASTGYAKEFTTALAEMSTNEVRVTASDSSVYFIKKLDMSAATAEEMESYRSYVLQSLKGDEFDASLEKIANDTHFQYNDEAKKLYTPNKLKFDF